MTPEQIRQLTAEDVVSVYFGEAGMCCCGCSGKHWYNSQYQVLGSKRRGYEVDADEVDDSQVTRVLNIIKRYAGRGTEFCSYEKVTEETGDSPVIELTNGGRGHLSFETATRMYVVYLI